MFPDSVLDVLIRCFQFLEHPRHTGTSCLREMPAIEYDGGHDVISEWLKLSR